MLQVSGINQDMASAAVLSVVLAALALTFCQAIDLPTSGSFQGTVCPTVRSYGPSGSLIRAGLLTTQLTDWSLTERPDPLRLSGSLL